MRNLEGSGIEAVLTTTVFAIIGDIEEEHGQGNNLHDPSHPSLLWMHPSVRPTPVAYKNKGNKIDIL